MIVTPLTQEAPANCSWLRTSITSFNRARPRALLHMYPPLATVYNRICSARMKTLDIVQGLSQLRAPILGIKKNVCLGARSLTRIYSICTKARMATRVLPAYHPSQLSSSITLKDKDQGWGMHRLAALVANSLVRRKVPTKVLRLIIS